MRERARQRQRKIYGDNQIDTVNIPNSKGCICDLNLTMQEPPGYYTKKQKEKGWGQCLKVCFIRDVFVSCF